MSDPQQTKKTKLIIVGAGPTGLSMAVQLLRYNIEFIIIERNERTTYLSKALVVQARTLEIFEEAGLADKAIKEGQVTNALNLFFKGRKRALVDITNLGEGLSPYPFALSLEQSKTEKLLVDHLVEKGVIIRWSSGFTHLTQNEKGVKVYYKDSTGQEQEIEGDYLIGCDGAASPVRHQLGLSFAGDTIPRLFYVADVTINSGVINKNELFMFMIKKGFILFFPMEGNGHYRIVGILPDAKEDKEIRFEDIEDYIKQEVEVPLEFKEIRWFSSYKVHSRKAIAFSKGRSFIAGDAAHIHTPAGGQGMNTGIQDAYNLAWKLAMVIRGEINGNVLETYNSERVENATHLLKTTDRMFDMMTGNNKIFHFIRLHVFPLIAGILTKNPFLKKRIFPLLSQTGISYPDSALTNKSSVGKTHAGIRMPYFILKDGKHVFEYIASPTFKLLFFGNNGNDVFKLINEYRIPITTHSFDEIPQHLFGNEKNFYILLRPDNHISYIGKDLDKCRELLDKVSPK